jgi:hypothetical protein
MWLEKRPKVGEDGLMSYEDSASNYAEKLRPAGYFLTARSKPAKWQEERRKGKEPEIQLCQKRKNAKHFLPKPSKGNVLRVWWKSVSHHLIFALCNLPTFSLSHQVQILSPRHLLILTFSHLHTC